MFEVMRRATVLVALLPAVAAAQQQDHPTFTVGTATAQRGATATGVIAVPAGVDSGVDIAVAVINGARPGKVVAFIAGVHGTEYSSTVALQHLITRIDPQRLAGTVIIVPLENVASFETMTPHLNPVDHKGMGGGYPGDPSGTQSQRAAALMTSQVVAQADVIVDLHGGDLDENLQAYSYWFRCGRPAQDSAGLRLAMAFGLNHILVTDMNLDSPNAGRGLGGQTLLRGKTLLVAEAGRSGVVTEQDLTELVDGSLNVLGALGMLNHPSTPVSHPMWLSGAGSLIAADSAGMFFASVNSFTNVTKGEVLGYTTDFLGRKTGEIKSPIDGFVTYIRGVPSMWPKAALANVAPVLSAPAPWKAPAPPT